MWNFFITNNRFAYLFLAALVGVGSYSLIAIPKESAPEVIIPVGVVTTVLPGAPAADIESLITNEIERGLSGLENVNEITSVSREGVSSVTVEFDASADLNESIQELKDEVDLIAQELPSEAEDPFVSEVNFVDQPIMTIAVSGDQSDFALSVLADELENEIEALPGISRVEKSGVRSREVTVILDQASLLRYELSPSDVTNAIRAANTTFPIGQIEQDGISYNVAFEGDLADSSDIQNVGITTRGGQPVYVRDVAMVIDGLAPARSLTRLSVDGSPSENAMMLNVYKQSGGDITAIARGVNAHLETLKVSGGLLEGLHTVTVIDSGEQIETDLIRLSSSGLQTVFLVILLLVVAIGWREGLLAGTAIPLSFLFGFIGLYFSENTINFLSLFSLILGIGILVDSAIVMVEGINRKMKDDPTIDKREAALQAIEDYRAPLIAGTLTTVAMFSGLFIVSGVIGQFIASIPFTLVFVLFASLFVSLAIIPLFASNFLRRRSTTKLEQKQVEYAHRLENWYQNKITPFIASEDRQLTFRAGLNSILVLTLFFAFNVFGGLIAAALIFLSYRWRYRRMQRRKSGFFTNTALFLLSTVVSIGIAVGLSLTVLPNASFVKVVFFEEGDVDYLVVDIEYPEGTTKEATDIGTRRVEEHLYSKTDIESFVTTVGSGNPFTGGGSGEKLASMIVSLKDDRELTSSELVEELRADMRDIREFKVNVAQPSDGPPTGAAIIVKFLGDDLTQITDLANSAVLIFNEVEHTTNVETSTTNNSTEFVLDLDTDKAAAYGVSPLTISQVARTAVFGTDATSLTTLSDDIDVVVKLNVANQTSVTTDTTNIATIDDINRITIPTQTGDVLLSDLVDVSLRESSAVINHEDGKRVVTVTADVTAAGNAREIQAEALRRINTELTIPDNVEISTGGGETEESNQAFAEMFLALVVGIGLMVGILVLQFNSYLHMGYVLSILPYSLIGIMTGLAITQSPLSFPSMMGFIALSGIVVNNSILLIDMMNQTRRSNPERPISRVVIESATNRLRPILLTTTTTVIGMIPLTYAGDLWAPLAYAVMFGLIFSVIITLLYVPMIYNRKPGTVRD